MLRARGAERRAIARDAVFRAAGGLTPSLAVDADGIRFHRNTADKEISRIVFIYGLYDRPLMHAAFEGLRRLGGPAGFGGRRLLDIGRTSAPPRSPRAPISARPERLPSNRTPRTSGSWT